MALKKEFQGFEDFKITESVNCIFEDKKIKARKGFFAKPEDYVFKSNSSQAFDISLAMTDCYLFADGKYGRIAINIVDNLMDNIAYNIMLICADHSTISLGKINFTTSGSTAGFPDSFVIFSGKANQGSGIYFLSRRIYGDGAEEMISVRELSRDKTSWILLTEDLIYTPIVLANGRGESYHAAEIGGRALNLSAPVLFESKNMLNSRFKAAYTTDGASSSFSLPYLNIDNTSVTAELLYKNQKHTFKITGTAVKSSAVTVDSASVVLNVDRAEGRVYFTLSEGGNWVPEFMGSLNNLCVTAYKTVSEHTKIMGGVSASHIVWGDVSLLYKSTTAPAAAVTNSPKDPLYFPENTAGLLGNVETQVGCVVSAAGNIFAFKEGEIYSARLNTYSQNKKTINILSELKQTEEYSLKFKKEASFLGEAISASIKEVNGKLIFQTLSGDIWETKVSGSLSPEKTTKIDMVCNFALADEGRYLLIKGNRAIVLENVENGYKKSEWILPEKAVGGFSYLGKAVFLYGCYIGDLYIVYPAKYGSKNDIKFISEFETKECEIEAFLRLKISKTPFDTKKLIKFSVMGEKEQIKFSVLNGPKKLLTRTGRFKNGFADFHIGHIVRDGYAEISFSKDSYIDGIIIEFKPIKTN